MKLAELLDGIDNLTDEARDNGLSDIAASRLRAVSEYCERVLSSRDYGDYAIGRDSLASVVIDLLNGDD